MKARRYLTRSIATLVVLLLAALTYPGAVLVSMIVRLTPPPSVSGTAPQGTMPWLHVAHPQGGQPYIADDQGRMVLLHGAIPGGLIDFWSHGNPPIIDTPPYYPIDPSAYDGGRCPDNSPTMPVPPLCEGDLSSMARLGFNSLRLPLSWSLLEPERGRFNQLYVDRVAQVVDWARARGVYVIIDMHQNAYSRYVGRSPDPQPVSGGVQVDLRFNTGAPAWATITDGFLSEVFAGNREVNPAVFESNSNFWYNRDGIQDEYIKAVTFLVRQFKDDSTIAGFSVFNEPWLGWNLPPGFEDLLLFPFYRRVIDAITGVRDGLPCWTGFYMPAVCGYPDPGVHDQRHLIFIDTGLLREVTDFPTHLGLPVSSYPNLVLGLHPYTHGYTIDALLGQKPTQAPSYPWGGYDQSYSLAKREAKAINAALFVAEFGNDPDWDASILPNELLEQEKHLVGFAFWTWKENCGAHSWGVYYGVDCSGTGFRRSSGCIRSDREALLARAYPRASADPNLTYHYDSSTGAFTLHARGRAGDAPTVVYIPQEVRGELVSSGGVQRIDVIDPFPGSESRLVTVLPSGGDFAVTVHALPVFLSRCGLI